MGWDKKWGEKNATGCVGPTGATGCYECATGPTGSKEDVKEMLERWGFDTEEGPGDEPVSLRKKPDYPCGNAGVMGPEKPDDRDRQGRMKDIDPKTFFDR